jgi:pyruvate kinase
MRHTKIVCTIGPNSLNETTLLKLHERGLNVVRLNGSHANLDWHAGAIKLVRNVMPNIPILLDIPGRKIRTIELLLEPKFDVGNLIILTTNQSHNGSEKVPVNYLDLHKDLTVGDCVMADDGRLKFTVVRIDGFDMHCRAEVAGQLGSRKGINVPYVNLKTPQVTERDKKMIDFAVSHGVDFIGLSFVESADHILKLRNLISGRGPRIVAKVENSGGLAHVDDIAMAADAIMIDRGDLSVETSLFEIPGYQKRIIEASRKHGKPVIVATEMLHTMMQNSAPTKAEVTDIANAVYDGCSATMLSGETAIGPYCIESVEVMAGVIDAAEKHMQRVTRSLHAPANDSVFAAIALSIDALSLAVPITKIVTINLEEHLVQMIADRRLPHPIFAFTDNIFLARSFSLLSGTEGVYTENLGDKMTTINHGAINSMLRKHNVVANGDKVLLIMRNNLFSVNANEPNFSIGVITTASH